MKGNTLYVIFCDGTKNILQPYHDKGLITVGWDYEWIVNGDQVILDKISTTLKETFNGYIFHTIEDGKIVWH